MEEIEEQAAEGILEVDIEGSFESLLVAGTRDSGVFIFSLGVKWWRRRKRKPGRGCKAVAGCHVDGRITASSSRTLLTELK